MVTGRPLVAGTGQGPLLALSHPISFWGGVDPVTGTIADPRHPEYARLLTGTVLLVPQAVGSSSSSAIMLELLRRGTAPAAILMGEADAILALGVVVAGELGHATVPVVEVDASSFEGLVEGTPVKVEVDGTVRVGSEAL